jgi:hypothetical protein
MADETKPETPEAKKDGPDYRPTKQIPKVEIQQSQFSELKSIMTEGFSKVDTAIFELGERVIRVEIRQKDLEDRMARHSGGTRQLSDVDAKHDAALATISTRLDKVESNMATKEDLQTNTDATLAVKKEIVDGVKGFWKRNPKLETALVALIISALGAGTFYLSARGH